MTLELHRVAIVDDEADWAATTARVSHDAGLESFVITTGDGPFTDPEDLLRRVKQAGCDSAILDHRLAPRRLALFPGAEAAAQFNDKEFPCVLMSTFANIDYDVSIRRYRGKIPVVLDRHELDPDRLIDALTIAARELRGDVLPTRRTWRALVRVKSVSSEGRETAVDAIVHTWRPDVAVRFPIEIVESSDLRQAIERADGELRLFAQVNVAAESDKELFLHSFELAPEPDLEALRAE